MAGLLEDQARLEVERPPPARAGASGEDHGAGRFESLEAWVVAPMKMSAIDGELGAPSISTTIPAFPWRRSATSTAIGGGARRRRSGDDDGGNVQGALWTLFFGAAAARSATFPGNGINAHTIARVDAVLGGSWSAPLTIGHPQSAGRLLTRIVGTCPNNGTNFHPQAAEG